MNNKNVTKIDNTDEIIFSDFYKSYPNGLFNGVVYRDIYCGKVNTESSKWLDNISLSDFRYRYVEDDEIYFVVDAPKA